MQTASDISDFFEVYDVVDDATSATNLVKGNLLSSKRDNASLL